MPHSYKREPEALKMKWEVEELFQALLKNKIKLGYLFHNWLFCINAE